MNQFRGQYMDMVHPSSDVKVTNKPNNAGRKPVVETPPAVSSSPEPEPEKQDFFNVPDEDAYESPFLPNIDVEKRPLGGSPTDEPTPPPENAAPPLNNQNSPEEAFDINKYFDLSQPELPADDGGKGELEPELPSNSETETNEVETSEIEIDEIETASPVINNMIMPQYEAAPTLEPTKPDSPFAHVSSTASVQPVKTKKASLVWAWIALFILLAIVGVAAGALIYLSGWFG
jgi:hypothetical protein